MADRVLKWKIGRLSYRIHVAGVGYGCPAPSRPFRLSASMSRYRGIGPQEHPS